MMLKKMVGVVVAVVLLSGCSDKPAAITAAPLGDKAVLEKLASSWEKVSAAKLSVSPGSLTGPERKQFLTEVFSDAGYDYTATLKQMAAKGIDKSDKLQTDMADLVLLPHRAQRVPMDPAEIYSIEELQAVAVVERSLNK